MTTSLDTLRELIQRLLAEHQITVHEYHFGSSGWARLHERCIRAPHPTDIDNCLVTLHEIGHIVQGHIRPIYLEEYRAEQYALAQARAVGIPEEELTRFVKRAQGYVAQRLVEAHERGVKMDRVPTEVSQWLGINPLDWVGRRVQHITNPDCSWRVWVGQLQVTHEVGRS